jgi:hypothetical protein
MIPSDEQVMTFHAMDLYSVAILVTMDHHAKTAPSAFNFKVPRQRHSRDMSEPAQSSNAASWLLFQELAVTLVMLY